MKTETKSKYTPGPWETGALMTRVEVLPSGWRMPMCIADCHAEHAPESESERVANVKLIAAAPRMAEALKATLAKLEAICESVSRVKSALPIADPLQNLLAYDYEAEFDEARAALAAAGVE